jgi:hypothetical protein
VLPGLLTACLKQNGICWDFLHLEMLTTIKEEKERITKMTQSDKHVLGGFLVGSSAAVLVGLVLYGFLTGNIMAIMLCGLVVIPSWVGADLLEK